MKMRLVDMHSHWGTRRGYVLHTEAALAQQSATWRSEPKYDTEEVLGVKVAVTPVGKGELDRYTGTSQTSKVKRVLDRRG